DNKRVVQPYTYFLKKNNLAKYNYKIYNKEILAIIYCLKDVKSFKICTDYKNLEYFITI
ncbi:hypothetical protein M430DRAFT_101476, partial [Amorphotheca resinae ATCC 22711]